MTQVLILSFFFTACSSNTQDTQSLALQWQDSLLTGIIIPRQLLSPFPEDSFRNFLRVDLMNDSLELPVFGEYSVAGDAIIFQPLIPLTPGLSYEVRFRKKSVGQIEIPALNRSFPEVSAVYPSQDTLPENLLKMYIVFTQPMREDNPFAHISVLRSGNDTLGDVFLDLRPALWNKEGTLLTLWLDPGRIKRDLQPNKNLGTPLRRGDSYKIVIDEDWPAKHGGKLRRSFSREFVVTSRDQEFPKLTSWTVKPPAAGTTDPVIILFPEPLDYVLLQEAVYIEDPGGSTVEGKIELADEEKGLRFTPKYLWQPGRYSLVCESRLEDLAGNNLNRLFDREITAQKPRQEDSYWIDFTID